MNRGLKTYTKQLKQELGNGCSVSVNINKNDANLHIVLPLLKTIGISPILTNLIYNYQDRDKSGRFGNGVKLNLFSSIEQISDGIRIHNADGSYDDYVGKDNYYNKETQCTGRYRAAEYNMLDQWTIEDKHGNKRIYYPPTDYPQVIETKAGDIFNLDFMATDKCIKNKYGDMVKFVCGSGGKVSKVVAMHNELICATAYLEYCGDNLIRIRHCNENDKMLSETTISYLSDSIIVCDTLNTFTLKYVLSEGRVTNIVSGYSSTFKRKKEVKISYDDNKTSITDMRGRTSYTFFDSNGLPLYMMDSDGNVTETEYDPITKRICSQSNAISTKKVADNLFPNNIGAFATKGVIVTKQECSDPFFKEILGDTVYKVTGDGELRYKINVKGIATDNITAVIWGKQLTDCTKDSYVSATLFAGDSDHDKFKKEKADGNFDLMTLGVENKSAFSEIELAIFLRGNASIELGGIQVLKKDFGTFYNYDDHGNANEIGKGGASTSVNYNSTNLPSQVVGANSTAYTCEYDDKGNVKMVSMAYDVTQENEFDSYKNITKSTVSNNDGSKKIVTEKSFTSDGRFIASEKDDVGNITARYSYDNYGKLISVIDALETVTSFSYDNAGLIKDIILRNNTKELSKASYTYYDNRLVKSVVLKNGSRYDFYYDSCNNVQKILLNGTTIILYSYDSQTGNLISQKNGPMGDGYSFEYNENNQITKVYYVSDKNDKSLRFVYTYNDCNQLKEVMDGNQNKIRELSYDAEGHIIMTSNDDGIIKYSYDNLDMVNNMERVIGGQKVFQSFDSLSRSKSTNPQSLREIFASDDDYIGLFSKDGNLIGKTKGLAPINHSGEKVEAQLKTDGLVPCALVDDKHSLSYMPGTRYGGGGWASGCIQFWFKPTESFNKKDRCIFNIKGYNSLDSISVYLNNGKLYLKTIDRDCKTETLITSDQTILEKQWNFFALTFINRTDEGTIGITEYALVLNSHVQHFKASPMIYKVDVGGDTFYNIGHRFDGRKELDKFNGYIACVNMTRRWYKNPADILRFYRLSKEYVIENCEKEGGGIADYGVTTLYTRNESVLNQFEIYPLNNSVTSLNGKKPIAFSIRNKSSMDKDKTFNFNKLINRYAYMADGEILTYDFGQNNSGTIVMRAIVDNSDTKQFFFDAKDNDGKTISLFRNERGILCVDHNGTIITTNLSFTAKEWHTVGISFGNEIAQHSMSETTPIGVQVYLDNRTYRISDIYDTFSGLEVTIGRKNKSETTVSNLGVYSTCFALNGQIEMLCASNVCYEKSIINMLIEEIQCSSKANLFDEFGRHMGELVFDRNSLALGKSFAYVENGENTSKQVQSETIFTAQGLPCVRLYDYDKMKRVTHIVDMSRTFGSHEYEYDRRGYLIKDDGTDIAYDTNGNIKSIGGKKLDYDNIIKDKLIQVGNTPIKYESNNPLNPTEYGDRQFAFEGSQLVKYTIAAQETDYYSIPPKEYKYQYNEQGLRIAKIAPEGTIKYIYDGTKMITELGPGSNRLDFLYDQNNSLYGFIKDGKDVYYYVKDCLQNILGIVDSTGELVVKYNQTAYGLVTIDLDSKGIGKVNPFRYKGYYYDAESGMYYCLSRYYVPEWGRWLNSGVIIQQDVYNAFVYMNNNPVGINAVSNSPYANSSASSNIISTAVDIQKGNGDIYPELKWKAFGYEHRTSAGWEVDSRMLSSSVLRVGVSSYITHSTAENPSVFYAFTGYVESDSLSLLGENWYAGVGMRLGNVFSAEIQVETVGIATKVSFGNFSIAADVNVMGGVSITFAVDKDLGHGYTSTTGFTIGVNFLVLVYVFVAISSLVQSVGAPSGQPSGQPAGQPTGPVLHPA